MILKYIKSLIRHTVNVFSLLSVMLALAALILIPLNEVMNAIVITTAAFISILFAGYFAWKEINDKLPQKGDVTLKCTSSMLTTRGITNGIPLSPVYFKIELDLINHSDEMVTLFKVSITEFQHNARLLGSQPKDYKLTKFNPNYGSIPIGFPLEVPGRSRDASLQLEIEVSFNERVPLQFAKRLGELNTYFVKLEYIYQDLDRNAYTRDIEIHGTFEEFKKGTIQGWKQNKNYQLLAEVVDM